MEINLGDAFSKIGSASQQLKDTFNNNSGRFTPQPNFNFYVDFSAMLSKIKSPLSLNIGFDAIKALSTFDKESLLGTSYLSFLVQRFNSPKIKVTTEDAVKSGIINIKKIGDVMVSETLSVDFKVDEKHTVERFYNAYIGSNIVDLTTGARKPRNDWESSITFHTFSSTGVLTSSKIFYGVYPVELSDDEHDYTSTEANMTQTMRFECTGGLEAEYSDVDLGTIAINLFKQNFNSAGQFLGRTINQGVRAINSIESQMELKFDYINEQLNTGNVNAQKLAAFNSLVKPILNRTTDETKKADFKSNYVKPPVNNTDSQKLKNFKPSDIK